MKKLITICLLVVTLLVGGMTMDAKTTKKKSKGSSSKQSSSVFANFTYDGNSWGLKKNGDVVSKMHNGKYGEAGKYVEDNSGYILVFGSGDTPEELAIIYKDTLYYLGFTGEIGNVDTYDEINFYFASNLYSDRNCIKNVITFNPNTESIRFKSNQGWKELYLSNVPAKDRYKVTWTK